MHSVIDMYKTFPSKQKTGVYHYTTNVPADMSSISEFLISSEAHKCLVNIVTFVSFSIMITEYPLCPIIERVFTNALPNFSYLS